MGSPHHYGPDPNGQSRWNLQQQFLKNLNYRKLAYDWTVGEIKYQKNLQNDETKNLNQMLWSWRWLLDGWWWPHWSSAVKSGGNSFESEKSQYWMIIVICGLFDRKDGSICTALNFLCILCDYCNSIIKEGKNEDRRGGENLLRTEFLREWYCMPLVLRWYCL